MSKNLIEMSENLIEEEIKLLDWAIRSSKIAIRDYQNFISYTQSRIEQEEDYCASLELRREKLRAVSSPASTSRTQAEAEAVRSEG